ncbi:E3 ubiquitin-protein ligase rnf213-alpha-like [Gadus chalcogrammus]|uniref:E3 ubiquitin-protein ligase rnf213-alpha-like n=1 Tax=Gadus chalcogrammus TaxID=1042646 RepID=UPI0024C343BB|nr:E3 ubiquitin-protein ligase rnf213-alpha-like [Gadus chalcogrammus]
MKCSSCKKFVKKTARYCSWCGHGLITQPVNMTNERDPLSNTSDPVPSLPVEESNGSPKPLVEGDSDDTKKQKKRRKMARKKTNESTSLNQESLTSGLLSMDDNLPDIQGEYSERDLNTNEGENNAGPLTDAYSTPETQPSSLKAYGTIQPSEGTTCNLNIEESTENPVTDSLSIATPDDKIHGERTVQKPAQASKSVQAKSSKSVHVESSKSDQAELSKSDQTESSKSVQDEASKSVQDEASKSVQDEASKCVQDEASKSVQDEASKSVQDEASKSVQDELSKSVQDESSKSFQDEASKSFQDEASKSVQDESSKSVPDEANGSTQVGSSKSAQLHSISSTNLGDDTKQQERKGTKSTNQNILSEKTKKDNTKKNNNTNRGDQKQTMDTNTDDTHQSKKQVKSGPPDQQGKQQPTGKQGPAAEKKQHTGSSVDTEAKVEGSGTKLSAAGGGDVTESPENIERTGDNQESEDRVEPSPKRINNANPTVAARDRLTIFFHAVLPKEFKLEKGDQIFIRAGNHIGTWNENLVEVFTTNDIGKHGFLVEGKFETTKETILNNSIPYKYVVYKAKKKKYKFEHIYKYNIKQVANRCLFVNSGLLNEEGDWHQYDDIICKAPSKGNILPRNPSKNVQGREIGNIMLDTIFDLPQNCTDIHLKNFLIQLKQFFYTYGNPFVYEDTPKKWKKYGENEVRELMKQFMLKKVIPQLEERDGKRGIFIAAVIMLHICHHCVIKLDEVELNGLCKALCFPKLNKEEFLQYWDKLSLCFVEDLPELLVWLINTVILKRLHGWILVLPLLHLLQTNSTPFQPLPLSKSVLPWNGLEGKGLHKEYLKNLDIQDLRELMSENKHLLEIDPLTARSWMCLVPIDELVEFSRITNIQLLDILHLIYQKTSLNIISRNHQVAQDGTDDEQYAKDLEMLYQAMSVMRNWISQTFEKTSILGNSSESEIQIWENVISLNLKNGDFTKEWKSMLTMDLEGKLQKVSPLAQIESYCSTIEKHRHSHPNVAAVIEKCALEAVTSLCKTKQEGNLFAKFKLNRKFGKLISAIIQKSWPKNTQEMDQNEEVFRHILSWTAAGDVFKLLGANEEPIEDLSDKAKNLIAITRSSFTVITDQLVNGNIKINLLKFILGRREAFLELLKIDLAEDPQYQDEGRMRNMLKHREAEMGAVYNEKDLVDVVVKMSHKLKEHMTVNLGTLEKSQQITIETMNLNSFMEVHKFGQQSPPFPIAVTYYKLKDLREMAVVLNTYRNSYLFKGCWEKQARLYVEPEKTGVADKMATPIMIRDDIFKPCYDEYQNIYRCLMDGSIKLGKVDTLLKDYTGKYNELEQDFDIMCRVDPSNDKQWIKQRALQIQQYHELHLAVESAQAIMLVKETLGLQGDFSILQTLLGVTNEDFKEEPLNRIDDNLNQAKMVLVDINSLRRTCLQQLGHKRPFVNWVKEALKDINELKVFVDLASIYAGENALDVDRVAFFHDAVLGYSPMLYDLKKDSGFQTFKDVLNKLWRALDNDSDLPKKLVDTARNLQWLKTVKENHGSVELSSLSLASSINTRGTYVISARNVERLSLDTALKLQIPEQHGKEEDLRWYTLEDLQELQNKLMLMSGKGDQGQHEVEHFAEVFANVQRLAEAFIALYTAGNPLFRSWEVKIICSLSNERSSIIIDFKLDEVADVIVVDGKIDIQLPEFCKKIEKCLNYWNDFVDKQRSKHYYLNYYTAEQIVYLCSKLSPQNVADMEVEVLMMLSFVKPNCTATDLREVWHEIVTNQEETNQAIEFQTFVDESEHLIGDSSITGDSVLLVEKTNCFRKFDLLWNSYMKDMNSFLPHILDLEGLGKLLEKLADKQSKGNSFTARGMPKCLTTGNPNLIVCSQEMVFNTCISIYMSDENEAMPTYDEVLLCNSSTSYEQVELFLRRCLTPGYSGRKIYTLLYGDLLTYDVSCKVEGFFQRMKMKRRKDYRLVMVCTSEREHAYIPSAFSQYRLHMVPQEPTARIQSYLSRHYSVPADECSAAAVFRDRLSVGVVSSERAGVGKSLYVKRLHGKLKRSSERPSVLKCIRLIEPKVDENAILQSLLESTKKEDLTIFHLDVTSSVRKGLHDFLFKLLILRYLMDSEGMMWKCCNKQLYLIEILKSTLKFPINVSRQSQTMNSSFIDWFPSIFCRPPKEVLMLEMENPDQSLMDDEEFRSEAFQRPYQYLTQFHNRGDLDTFKYNAVEGSHVECLQMLLMYCGIMDPSWAEIRNFAWFLNLQLKDCETSVFCNVDLVGDTLRGFKSFVVDFMILMAKDFATPSLNISDKSPGRLQFDLSGLRDEDLTPFLIRKRWESEPHPYIFFNSDHVSMTFIGFHLKPNGKNSLDAIDPSSKKIIKKNIMTKELFKGLTLQGVPFNINFDELPRGEKIESICNVLGTQQPLDPDETYELTTDNILKILAIHMRFRCGIPVIIMGETGCGKTRLIKYLCDLQRGGVATENMKLVKVHGGTNSDIIYTKVREAEAISLTNKENYGFDSVLFFDEANTTEAIGSIKEIICDHTVKGEMLTPNCGLQIIAACNPYRKHTEEMITKLESAGLGYRVRAEETDEKLGSIPLRQLVYRVQALPPSMIPLVWDFGQLNDNTEEMYIQQIVQRVVGLKAINGAYIKIITDVLADSQRYMRKRKDECSFVSLRDVERCMQAFMWFYENHAMFFTELEEFEKKQRVLKNEVPQREGKVRDPVLWSLIMAAGVCYHACLENKDEYRLEFCKKNDCTPVRVMQEISLMQDLLLSGVPMGETIAKNSALKENVFMMVLCIELRIPLFLVGKPGSSKSLSKTLVADAMQGQAAHSELFKKFKQIHLVSFQCSPHSTPEGIINTFKQCGRFQVGKNLDEYISVVVLDEIGLAEDSPKMPLKTLHPLLEEGCIDDEPLPHKRVGFIGISNWALDPAKMNRGIFVSRGDPDEKELLESAKGICSSDAMLLEEVRGLFKPFAKAYLDVCQKQGKGFFGLRDYYSLVKMIFAITKGTGKKPSEQKIVEAVLRNFSGKDTDVLTVFTDGLNMTPNLDSIDVNDLVRQNILASGQEEECRYLLVLTKNYAALQILQQTFFSENKQPEIIFGSSFPKDQEYTQICRNINRVKICMETGHTVILLNLQNLYESLYDALNQYYVYLGGQKYIDLGLGTHRVKCRVHNDFRLIVIEEKEVVYKQFPIPLINRLEKHYLDIHTVLKKEQKSTVKKLERWVEQFVSLSKQHTTGPQGYKYQAPDVFIGYHSDTCASVILQVIERRRQELETSEADILQASKLVLLNCATPDSILRLDCTMLPKVESERLSQVYSEEQNTSCLADFILAHMKQDTHWHASFTEVTTFSRLLTAPDLEQLEQLPHTVELLSLQQFETEQSFLKKIRLFFTTQNGGNNDSGNKILIIQSDFASHSAHLVASAKYSSLNEITKIKQNIVENNIFVYFITKLPRMKGGTSYVGFHGGPWKSVHIDDLRKSKDIASDIKALRNLTISELFDENRTQPKAMEHDDMEYSEGSQNITEGWDFVLDTTALLRSCVQSAVGMLRDQVENGYRSTKRVEILLTLLNDNADFRGKFLRIVKRRLQSLLLTQNCNPHLLIKSNWVIKESSNIDAIQEGGTFRHTLWKRVQAVVIPYLAQLVSIIDRDQNLDILVDCNEPLKTLWLDIFGKEKLLDVPSLTIDLSSAARTILVQNCFAVDKNISCSMPFSWRLRDYLEELWVYALKHEGQTQSQFDELFWKTHLGQSIAKASLEMQSDFFQRYLQDFISMTMNVRSQENLQLLCSALNCCVNEMQSRTMETHKGGISLPWVHAAYYEFKNRLQNFARMINLEPRITQVLLNKHAQEREELVLDIYAAIACVEFLESTQLETDGQRQAWLRQVKKLHVPIELICSHDSVMHYGDKSKTLVCIVQTWWNRIFTMSLFVEHLLLGDEEAEMNLNPLVLEHMRILGQTLKKNSDLKKQQAFEEVIVVLKACKDKVVQSIFRFGLQLCPVCMSDPKDPLSLPCDHIYCSTCIKQWLVPGQMYCPLCKQAVPEDFSPTSSEEIRIQFNQHAKFRTQCNAFFIDLVSTMCFKDNIPPCSSIIHNLLSLVMLEAEPLPIFGGDRHILTKVLSPFDESVDKNPVVRSFVLKLLLKFSFEDVKGYLQQHLTEVEQSIILEKTDKTELYSMYINCLEDSMFERRQFRSVAEQQAYLQDERVFLSSCTRAACPDSATVEHLQQVARVRMGLDMAATLLVQQMEGAQSEGQASIKDFLAAVMALCSQSNNDWFRVYLIRKIGKEHGVEFVQSLLKVEGVHWVFPKEVLQKSEEGSPIDNFLVCGEGYKTIRDALTTVLIEGKVDVLDKAYETCKCLPQKKAVYLLLALFREVTSLYGNANGIHHPKPGQCRVLVTHIDACGLLVTAESKDFAKALVANRLGALAVVPGAPGGHSAVLELTVHMASVLLCANQRILVPLQNLALSTGNMQQAFLPTMPEDMLFVAQQAMGPVRWYYCPNKHPCAIGECGRPWVKSNCPDCGAEIGGTNHIPVAGFTDDVVQGDRTQTGHVLGDPERRDNPDTLDTKNMSPGPFTLMRMLTHMAMLYGASINQQLVAQIIRPPVADPGAFLLAHLLKDMEHLTKSLGKGTDDTIHTVHLLLCSLLEPHRPQQGPDPYDDHLSTKDYRDGWEKSASNTIIIPQLKHLDRRLRKANDLVRADARVSRDPVFRLMFCDPDRFLASLPRGSLIHGQAVWSCREELSLQSLTHIVEQHDGKDSLPLLWRFLQREAQLRFVKFLPDILTLQKDLVKKFQNICDLPFRTIADFLNSQQVSLRDWYERGITIFLTTWNQLRVSLANNGEIKIPAELCEEDLDLNSDFRLLLPQRQGPGLCSTALVSYLIALHNEIITCVDKHTGEQTSYEVSPTDLTDQQVIRYELDQELMPLVLANSQYSLERGKETLHEYDLAKIQQQVLTHFLQGRPIITLQGIPTLVNRHERDYAIILKDVKGKVEQEALQSRPASRLAAELRSYSEVCEALTALEVALGFLAMTGGDPDMQLSCYLEEVLQMKEQTAPHVLKALAVCRLRHCVALWQLLTSLKSQNMMLLKGDPFAAFPEKYKLPLSDEDRRLLSGKTVADGFLLEMHEFLLLKLKNPNAPEEYRPDWGLKVTVVSYMEHKDLDVSPEVEDLFPEEICLSQYIEAWKFSVVFKQENSSQRF